MSSRFEERLRSGPPIVADGGMGTLISGAVPRLRCPEEANLRAPESVVALHASFIRAGAELIETNTFGANRRKLAAHFLEDDFERINSSGVRLAREAREVAGADVFIAGSIGPSGEMERFDVAEQSQAFSEQAQVLEGRGVDLLMLETFFDLEELVAAVEAVRACLLPPHRRADDLRRGRADTRRRLGQGGSRAARRARRRCRGRQPQRRPGGCAERACRDAAGRPRAGGAPERRPREPRRIARRLPTRNARLLRRVCGTGAAAGRRHHRRLLRHDTGADRRDQDRDRRRSRPAGPLVVRERQLADAAEAAPEETGLARMLREQEFVVSVQLDPPLGANNSALMEASLALKESGKTHFVDVNDNPRARARMSGIMASVAIERTCGIETIPHLTTRDMSVAGLESLLLGAHAEGVRNILAVTGDPPEEGDYPGARGVYEVEAIGLTRLISGLNRGEDYHGRGIDAPTSFFVGVAVNPSADDMDLELERFERKLEAGAQFAMTQILFDLAYLDAFFAHFGGRSPIPLLVGVWPMPSLQLAVRIHNEVPGIVVPEPVQERLRAAGTEARAVGRELARELIAESREKAAGVYVVAPFRQPLGILDVL